MKWHKLKENRCPKCGKDFMRCASFAPPTNPDNHDIGAGMIICNCGFKITQRKMELIVTDKISTEILREWENDNGQSN